MPVPVALIVGGMALSAFGRFQANAAQAQSEIENAAWLDQQAEFIEFATERELEIAERDFDNLKGDQITSFAKSGVDLSGSALDTLNETFSLAKSELEAIKAQGEIQKQEALLKAGASRRRARLLRDPLFNLAQIAGAGLQTASLIASTR